MGGDLVKNKRVMKVYPTPENSQFLYQICEWVEGITLRQWMYDNPKPSLNEVRDILEKSHKAFEYYNVQTWCTET